MAFQVYSNFSRAAKEAGKKDEWNYKEWGNPPKGGRRAPGGMYEFLHKKAEEEGIYKRMAEHIESPENKLHPSVAIQLLAKRDEPIADDLKRVREIFLKGTKAEDFDKLDQALKDFGRVTAENRLAYAELLENKKVGQN